MADVCGDNRFKIIEEFKQKLLKYTNINSSKDEMKVLDDILFRFWQMGWLDKIKQSEKKIWHSSNETPDEIAKEGGYLIIVDPRVSYAKSAYYFNNLSHWQDYVNMHPRTRWCYLDDIIKMDMK